MIANIPAETDMRIRCPWAAREPSLSYHDHEWGTKQTDEHRLFELLVLEGAQAGLSWETILRKRDGYRAAFAHFDPVEVARFDTARIDILVTDTRIVRHRGKIASAVHNARAFLEVQREHGSFASYLWGFTGGAAVVTRRGAGERLPARTELSDRVSTDLRARGFSFVGSTIVYAYLQAIGVVDDHFATCFRAAGSPGAGRLPPEVGNPIVVQPA